MCRQLNIRWQKAAKQAGTQMEAIAAASGTAPGRIIKQLKPFKQPEMSYKELLKRFAANREQLRVDADAFDFGFYNYGLTVYENMPLIEELEYREEQRIEEFAIVLDTSGSCSGRIIQRFIDETLDVLMTDEIFTDRARIHIIQCDNEVQSDTVIMGREDIERFRKEYTVKGFGGTDFRPAFEYVNGLITSKQINRLQGMIYFTDGHGIYPKAVPAYKTAFVFPYEDDEQKNVPAWAVRIILK